MFKLSDEFDREPPRKTPRTGRSGNASATEEAAASRTTRLSRDSGVVSDRERPRSRANRRTGAPLFHDPDSDSAAGLGDRASEVGPKNRAEIRVDRLFVGKRAAGP